MKLEKGRPSDCSRRQEKELRVYDLLDKLGISYERVDHEQADTMDDCVEIDEILQASICKNLFLCNRQKTQFFLLMILGEKKFKTKDVSTQIGSARLSFAGAEDMEAYLDILPGSVSVMGLMNDTDRQVQLLVDRDLLEEEYVGCHPCVNTVSLKLRITDVLGPFLEAVQHEPVFVTL